LAEKVRQLTITGRTKVNLKRLGKELAKKIKEQLNNTTEGNANLIFPIDKQTSLKDFK
jgi:hypothetical protein